MAKLCSFIKLTSRYAVESARSFCNIIKSIARSRKLKSIYASVMNKPGDVIAIQTDSFDKGGLEEVVLMLARNLHQGESVKVVIFVTGEFVGHLGAVAEECGIPVIAIGENRFLLRKLIKSCGVQLVNLHYSTFGIEEYARANVPIVYTIHNTYIWADPLFVRERLKAYCHVSTFIAVSEVVKKFFIDRFQVDPSLVITVPNGLDLAYVSVEEPVTRQSLGFTKEDIVFLNVASFNWNKFQILLLAAMETLIQKNPRVKLLIVGNNHGPDCRHYVESEIERRGLGACVKILDYVPKGKVIGLMRMADCFVLPSLIEGWSIAIMEAMYCELPLILSDVGSARDVIIANDIGIVIQNPYPDIKQLTPEIIAERYTNDAHLVNVVDLVSAMETIASDKEEWKRRAKIARFKVENQFNAAHMSQQYLACFKSLITRKKGEK